jgi:hypothetical protein
MSFKPERKLTTELFTRTDIANLLNALEPSNPRSGFEYGWIEGFRRLGMAVGIRYDAPERPRGPALIDEPQVRS